MTKHALGPWTTKEGHRYIAIRSDAGVWADIRIAGGGITEQDRANARLIAAAPDMLDALRKIETTLDSVFDGWIDSPIGEALYATRAAIAKATGA